MRGAQLVDAIDRFGLSPKVSLHAGRKSVFQSVVHRAVTAKDVQQSARKLQRDRATMLRETTSDRWLRLIRAIAEVLGVHTDPNTNALMEHKEGEEVTLKLGARFCMARMLAQPFSTEVGWYSTMDWYPGD